MMHLGEISLRLLTNINAVTAFVQNAYFRLCIFLHGIPVTDDPHAKGQLVRRAEQLD